MTPLALAREWAKGEAGLGLYLGCLAIRKSGAGACTVVRVEKVRGNMATIVPSTSLSIRRSDPGRSPSFAPSAKVRLSVATSALVLMPVGMLREALEVERRKENKFARDKEAEKMRQGDERRKKSNVRTVRFQGGEGGGGRDLVWDREAKGNFASEDIRMRRNALVKVEEDDPCKMVADVGKMNCVEKVKSGQFISWIEGLKSSDLMAGQDESQGRESQIIVDAKDEAVEEDKQEDFFGEKNIEDWMKELQVEEERYFPVRELGSVFDADDDGVEDQHTLEDSCDISREVELKGDCPTTRLTLPLMPREKKMSKPCKSLGIHSEQECPPVYTMKEGKVYRVTIFMADSPFNMVGRPVALEKEYQELLDNLSSYFCLKPHETFLPTEGSYMAARVQGKGWVRVKVQEVTKGSCRVLLIDNGWEAWLPPNLLQPLLPSHCDLPQLAQVFHLNSVSPVGGGRKWTKSSIEQLQEEVLHAEVEVKVLGPPVSKNPLPSYPVSIDVPTLVADNPMQPSVLVRRNLSLSLIESGMALPARKRVGMNEFP